MKFAPYWRFQRIVAERHAPKLRALAAGHLADVQAKIVDLRAMEHVLADVVRRCDAGEAPGCPLIETLSRYTPQHLPASRISPGSKDLGSCPEEAV